MRVAELFHSVQGEGMFAGTPSVFLRTTGCNLRCWFCDTPYTSWNPEGQQRPWRDVLQDILAIDCEHVVITGGEPLLQRDVTPLTMELTRSGRLITIETAGTVWRDVNAGLLSISPKLSNSTPRETEDEPWAARHNRLREQHSVIRRMLSKSRCQFKFVIDTPTDLEEVERYLVQLPEISRAQVWLMPQAITRDALAERRNWLEPLAIKRGFHYAHRLHIELYGNTRGT